MKRVFAFLLVIILCLGFCACGKLGVSMEELGFNIDGLGSNTEDTGKGTEAPVVQPDEPNVNVEMPRASVEGPGYDSPEEAILAYAAALKTADISKILSTFAIETYVENFDLEEYINTYRTLNFSSIPLESWNSLTGDFALVNRKNEIAEDMSDLGRAACLGYDYVMENMSIFVKSPDVTDEMLDQISGKGWEQMLAKMEYSMSFIYGTDIKNDEAFALSLQKTAAAYGCDEIVPIAIRITLNGTRYYLCVDVARYGDKWYNLHAGGHMLNAVNSEAYAISGGIIPVE